MQRTTRFPLAFAAGLVVGIAAFTTCSRPVSDRGTAAEPTGVAGVLQRAVLPSPAFAATTDGGEQLGLADVAAKAIPSVVNVAAKQKVSGRRAPRDPFFDFFGPQMPQPGPRQGLGSGVIVSRDGIVLTNNHVVENADEIRVTLPGGREVAAAVKGTDPKSDLAVLQLEGDFGDLQPIAIGDSDELRPGDVVLAIGNPFGVGQTVTMGIVSATGRANMGIVDYEDFIQTDAAINPGNSGGALVNMRGELVGVNTAILSRTGGYQGIGFAIPSNMAEPIMGSLLEDGKVVRGWLGVTIQTLDEELAAGLGVDVERGVLVSDVAKDGPAAKAGFLRGDVIVAMNGKPMKSTTKLRNAIAAAGPGSEAVFDVIRGGKRSRIEVTLGELPADVDATGRLAPEGGALEGATIGELSGENRRRFEVPERIDHGVVVTGVEPGSAAQRAGLQPGDVILEVNRKPVESVRSFRKAYRATDEAVLLLVSRGETTIYIALRK